MDLIKIGKFIALKRKEQSLTQSDLAEKLNISDRAVSKWERGINLPDASIMIELCEILDITVNDLLSGHIVNSDDYQKEAEENLVNLKKRSDEANKKLLFIEDVLIVSCLLTCIPLLIISGNFIENIYLKIVMIVLAALVIITIIFIGVFIERNAGYYECKKCNHRYIPTYKAVVFSMHSGKTRRMKCPKCHEKSWQRKVISE